MQNNSSTEQDRQPQASQPAPAVNPRRGRPLFPCGRRPVGV